LPKFLSELLDSSKTNPYLEQINLDKISLFIRFPKYQNGIAIFLKIPGLSYAIALDNKEKNLLLKSFEEKIKEEKERRKKKEEEIKIKKQEEILRKQKEDEIRMIIGETLKKQKEEELKNQKEEELKKQKEEDEKTKIFEIQNTEKKTVNIKNVESINPINMDNKIIMNLKAELDKYIKENNQLNEEIKNLKKENKKLKDKLENLKSINNYPNNIIDLKKELNNKEKEINELYDKLSYFDKNNKTVNFNDIMVINFVSGDGTINEGIKCLKTDTFAEVEEKLYQKYEEYREKNNVFLFGGQVILRFKKIYENKIKDGDKVQLQDI
jgi:hypothetical protein